MKKVDITWNNFQSDDLRAEELIKARDYISSLEATVQENEATITNLRDTNHRLYLRVTDSIPEPTPEPTNEPDIRSILFPKEG